MNDQNINILYIQFRHGDIREHETQCIEKSTGINREFMTVVNVFERLPTIHDLEKCSAVIVGGSGDYCLSEGHIKEEVKACSTILYTACERNIPILTICFGAQILTVTLGGKVEQDLKRKETGTYEIELLPYAKSDVMYATLPQFMDVQQGHKDGLVQLPNDAIPLARSLRWENQSYVLKDAAVYALQFHPELSIDDMIYRLHMYKKKYVDVDEDFEQLLASLRPTADASTLPRRFIEECVLRTKTPVFQEIPQYQVQ